MSRRGALVLAAALFLPAPASADWRLAPIAGTTIGTETGFVDLDGTASRHHLVFGISLTGLSSGLFGLEVEATVVPSVFTGHQLVDSSRVLTGSASLVVAVPPRVWRIRPYAARVALRGDVRFIRTTTGDDNAFAVHSAFIEMGRITGGVALIF